MTVGSGLKIVCAFVGLFLTSCSMARVEVSRLVIEPQEEPVVIEIAPVTRYPVFDAVKKVVGFLVP